MKLRIGNKNQQSDISLINEYGNKIGYIFSKIDAEKIVRKVNEYEDIKSELECHKHNYKTLQNQYLKSIEVRDSQNRELVEELKKTRVAIKNGLEFGYIYKCECANNWLKRIEKLLEKVEEVE